MKKAIFAIGSLLFATAASAQVVIIGPNSRLIWSDPLTPLATAQTLVPTLTVDGTVSTVVLVPTCIVNTTLSTTSDCSFPASVVPIGTHTITMTNTLGTLVSTASTPYSYTTMLIPIPTSVHIARAGHFWNKHYVLG